MYFKPKIFISSVLSLIDVRNSLLKYFKSVGAEVLLYEKNLTPSISKNTYRQDIVDSDFVVFIIDESYGSKTENGISGTHEEYKIVSVLNIPSHVYIKNSNSDSIDLEKFKDLIKSDNTSYYLYKNNKDLITQIKAKTFQVAKEISLNSIDKLQISPMKLLKAVVEIDYRKGMQIFRDICDIRFKLTSINLNDYQLDIFTQYFDDLVSEYNRDKFFFIDSGLSLCFDRLLDKYSTYGKVSSDLLITTERQYSFTLPSGKSYTSIKLQFTHNEGDWISVKEKYLDFNSSLDTLDTVLKNLKYKADLLT